VKQSENEREDTSTEDKSFEDKFKEDVREEEDVVPGAPTRRPKPGPVRCHTGVFKYFISQRIHNYE
jgi:hypothetical protein